MEKRNLRIVVPVLLVAAVWSLCGSLSRADIQVSCTPGGKGVNARTCWTKAEDETVETTWQCTKHKNGTWSCVKVAREAPPSDLKDAVIKAAGAKQAPSKP